MRNPYVVLNAALQTKLMTNAGSEELRVEHEVANQRLVFMREQWHGNGVGPLTVHFSDALNYSNEWAGITRIRLVPGFVRRRRYRYELVRDGALGPETYRPPNDLFYIEDPAAKAKLTLDLLTRLNLRHTVVDGVDEFRTFSG
jgi:hypothetical protein